MCAYNTGLPIMFGMFPNLLNFHGSLNFPLIIMHLTILLHANEYFPMDILKVQWLFLRQVSVQQKFSGS